ncbi:MAG TPA: SDR family NAD(P)-dependent oxidoreductase [Candidatus Limnocylindrales bacterium]|nr:SDR family NAD(P)-dependent oxidoreductase [Candidatus Limnocylindrales bacterium]
MRKIAVVTGASAGIGAASARRLAADGFDVVIGARRTDRLAALASEIGARWAPLDVTNQASVDAFCAPLPTVHVLVNNAGGAKGLAPLAEANEEHWRWMYETNVLGLMRMTRGLLPALERSGDGHVVNVGSIAGIETYAGGAGYTSVKHAVRAISHTLRLELLGRPVRVTEIAPGLVETEFSLVRFDGDAERASKVYAGMQPLTADDIADCISWAVTRPSHVNIDYMLVNPRAQARATLVHREQK